MKQRPTFRTMAAVMFRPGLLAVLTLGLLLGAASCSSKDDSHSDAEERSIAFRVDDDTRAAVTTTVRKIGVFGYSHAGSFTASPATKSPDYFLNQAVIDRLGDGNWSYSGVTKYWPREEINLSFFAYAPYVDVEDILTLRPASISETGAPAIEYTTPVDVYNQIDLLWDNQLDQTYASNSGQVKFTMEHALTQVGFKVKLHENEKGRPFIVEITEMAVQNVVGTGVLDMSKAGTDTDLWSPTRPADDSGLLKYAMTPGYGGGLNTLIFDARNENSAAGELDPYVYNDAFVTGQYLMLIPQPLSRQSDGLLIPQVSIKYSYVNVYSGETVDDEKVIDLTLPALDAWSAGQAITYRIEISLIEGSTIDFEIKGFIDGDYWENASENPIDGGVN